MEKHLVSDLRPVDPLVVLMEELLVSGLRHIADPLRAAHHAADRLVIVHHAVGHLVIIVLQTENLDTKRSSVSLIKTMMEN
jgi:hypothetical protein